MAKSLGRQSGCGDGLGKDLCIAASEIIGIDGGGVVECVLLETGDGKWQSVCGGGFGDDLRDRTPAQAELGRGTQGFGDGDLAGNDDGSRIEAERCEELDAGDERLAEAGFCGVEAEVELVAAGIEESVDVHPPPVAMRLRRMGHPLLGQAGEDGEAREGDQREVEGMAEALGGAESDAHSGEGARAMDDGDGIEFAEANRAIGYEGADGWDETLGCGTAGKGYGGSHGGRVDGVRQGQAAGGTASIDEENLQIGAVPCVQISFLKSKVRNL